MNTAPYALRPRNDLPRIYLYRPHVDFRKSQRGLSAIVQMELGLDPFDGSLFVFRNRAFDKLKLIFWEINGFVMYYKVLAQERFHWPRRDQEIVHISGEQLNWLLSGYDINALKPHKTVRYESVV